MMHLVDKVLLIWVGHFLNDMRPTAERHKNILLILTVLVFVNRVG